MRSHWTLSSGASPQFWDSNDVQNHHPNLKQHLVLWTSHSQLILKIISFSSPGAINAITLNAG